MIWLDVLVQGILLGGLYALFAAGLSLVFGIMRLVNLAHGDLIVFAAFAILLITATLGLNPFLAALLAAPLMFAAAYQRPDVLRFLLRRGADVNARDRDGRTPLLYGLASGSIAPDGVRVLLEAGADVNARASDGTTALTALSRARQAARSSTQIVTLLRKAGAKQ